MFADWQLKTARQVPGVEDVFGVEYYPSRLKRAFQKKFFPKTENPLHLKKSFCFKKFDLKGGLKQRHSLIDYLNRKALADLFERNIPQNGVLVLKPGGNVSLMMDKHDLLTLKLDSLAPGIPRFEDIKVKRLDLSRVVYRVTGREDAGGPDKRWLAKISVSRFCGTSSSGWCLKSRSGCSIETPFGPFSGTFSTITSSGRSIR